MLSLVLALIGLPVGLALDALIVRLAVAPGGDGPSGEAEGVPDGLEGTAARDGGPSSERAVHAGPPSVHAELGSLVVDASPERDWLRRSIVAGCTAVLFALVGARYAEPSHLAVVAAYVCVLLVCAGTDAVSYRVPNVVTYPAMLGAVAVGALMPDADLREVLAGGLLYGGLLFLPALFTGGVGMGMGDVKLATFVGLALGLAHVVPAMVVMALLGGVAAAFLLITRRRKRGEPIPYAPFISAGALAALLWQGAAFVDFV